MSHRRGKPAERDVDNAAMTAARREFTMSLLLLIVLILLLVGGLPRFGYHSYGYGPSGLAGVVLLVVIILLLTGRL
jgi:hypothetical protein